MPHTGRHEESHTLCEDKVVFLDERLEGIGLQVVDIASSCKSCSAQETEGRECAHVDRLDRTRKEGADERE